MASSADGRTSPSWVMYQECQRKRRRPRDEESEESEESEEDEQKVEEKVEEEVEEEEKVEEKEVGIRQSSSGKWYGHVNDTAHYAMNPGDKKSKKRITPSFSTRAEAVKALAELKAKIKEECETIILARVKADPLVRDLPRAPEDISEAVRKKAYWVCTYNTKFIPKRMRVAKNGQGLQWSSAREVVKEKGAVEEKEVGVRQTSSGKWHGHLSDTAHSAMNPGGKKKMRCTPYFSTRAEAVKARAELKATVKEECETIILARVKADPLVNDIPRAPEDISEAVRKKAYWVCNYKNKFIPKRVMVVKSGKQGLAWAPACSHDKQIASCMSCSNGNNNFCSELCGTMLYVKRKLSHGGSGLCAMCDPDRQTKQDQPKVSREQFFAIANDQYFPDLHRESVYGVACDETLGSGASHRRPDLATRMVDNRCGTQFVHLDECDEDLHLKGKNCYDRDGVLGKLSGHMHDIGAPAIPKEDGAYLDANPLTPEEAKGEVQNAKTRNVARVLNKVVTQQQAQMIPIRVLSVGVDGYTDSTGKKHKSAFVEYKNEKGEPRIRTNPEEWAHRLECFVREKTKLLELGASGPSIVHVRLFYNGSDRETGLGVP